MLTRSVQDGTSDGASPGSLAEPGPSFRMTLRRRGLRILRSTGMNACKSALCATLVAASTAAAQRATPTPGRSLATGRSLGMIGDGFSATAVVFDANTDTVLGSVDLGFGNNTCYGD